MLRRLGVLRCACREYCGACCRCGSALANPHRDCIAVSNFFPHRHRLSGERGRDECRDLSGGRDDAERAMLCLEGGGSGHRRVLQFSTTNIVFCCLAGTPINHGDSGSREGRHRPSVDVRGSLPARPRAQLQVAFAARPGTWLCPPCIRRPAGVVLVRGKCATRFFVSPSEKAARDLLSLGGR